MELLKVESSKENSSTCSVKCPIDMLKLADMQVTAREDDENDSNDNNEESNSSSNSSSIGNNNNNNTNNEAGNDVITTSNSSSSSSSALFSTGKLKRTQLIELIYDLYDLSDKKSASRATEAEDSEQAALAPSVVRLVVEGVVEKLPPGKNLKNSILLAWRRLYFALDSAGKLSLFDLDNEEAATPRKASQPYETFNVMGASIEYDQNKVIILDDRKGNCIVFRTADTHEFAKWKNALETQAIDRSNTFWVRPNQPLLEARISKKALIVEIGSCSIRAGLFSHTPELPKMFVPSVCARDAISGQFKVGFDAFDFLLSSSAPSTIDLRKSVSSWSLASSSSTSASSPLIFPFRKKSAIDKLTVEVESIEAIVQHAVRQLEVSNASEYELVLITPHKFNDKLNADCLNMLLGGGKALLNFQSATIIPQTLLTLYAYNANAGVVVHLGEKIDIVPICNGVTFQNGIANLTYGGNAMSEFLNSFISRGHVSYVNDIEQYFVRYVKENACYATQDYKQELAKYPNDKELFEIALKASNASEFKKVAISQAARFKSVEGLFEPELWGIDGQGIHKLVHRAIQSTSIDLRREMAKSIYLSGGMSRIPGLVERLDAELRKLLPANLSVKVNCAEHSYHCSYLGAFRFIQQPEYEKLMITRDQWHTESFNCLRKWRMM